MLFDIGQLKEFCITHQAEGGSFDEILFDCFLLEAEEEIKYKLLEMWASFENDITQAGVSR